MVNLEANFIPRVKTNSTILTLQSFLSPFETLDQLSQQYGDIFITKVAGLPPTIILSHPDDIKSVVMGGYNLFDSGITNNLLQPFLGSNSLLLLDNQEHEQRRKILAPTLSKNFLKQAAEIIAETTENLSSHWSENHPIKVCEFFRELSLSLILKLIFGANEPQIIDRLQTLIVNWLDLFSSPLTTSLFFFPILRQDWGRWSPWGRFLRLRQEIDSLIYSLIEQQQQILHNSPTNQPNSQILSGLILARDEQGNPMRPEEIRNEIVTLLFAGHETIAAALSWLLYWVHYQPEIKKRLLDELSTCDEYSNYSQLTQLPYLTAVCQESLRIYPINLMAEGRILKQSFSLRNYQFSPGSTFMPCIYLLHQREEIYPDPQQFIPERFLEKKYSSFEYMPFGGGNRRCIGMNLALFEMKLVTIAILLRWNLEYPHSKSLKPIRRGTVMSPPDSFQLIPINKIV
jgi:cytochrome P450